jgi:uncharacterized DUF497 family protein
MSRKYLWDPEKAVANLRKHGVSFEEAAVMLDGDRFEERPDIEHSLKEVRVRTIGHARLGRLLVVITSISGPRPRIISARRATKRERHEYAG